MKDEFEPQNLPSGGSGALERMRSAHHEQGDAPDRKGAEKDRDEHSEGDPDPKRTGGKKP